MIRIRSGHVIGTCIGGQAASKGGIGTILANTNSVTITHGLGVVPTYYGAWSNDDVTAAAGVQAYNPTATQITVGYPVGVTQPSNGTFSYEVGL